MKKNILITLILIIAIVTNSFAQEYIIQAKSKRNKLWGYINLNGECVIEPQFRTCYSFSENGLASIYYDGIDEFELINLKNEPLKVELDYLFLDRKINGFKDGLVPFLYNRKWGYLNSEGKVAIQNKYNSVTEFDNGHAIVKREKQYYVIDKQGNETLVNLIKIHTIKKFTEGLAPYIDKKGNFGFINMEGKVVIEAQYEGTGYFKSGLAWARTKDGKIGYINSIGEWVISPRFKTVHNFDEESGLARVEIQKQWMYVNKMGELFMNNKFNKIGDYSEGIALAEINNKVGFINTKQEWIIEPKFESVRNFKNGYAAVKLEGAWGLIDKQGSWIIQPTFAALKDVVKIN